MSDEIPDFYFTPAWSVMVHVPEIASIRHRSAVSPGSGERISYWEFLPRGGFPLQPGRIHLFVCRGNASVEVDVPVSLTSSPKDRIPGTWVLLRRAGDAWLLSAARMPHDLLDVAHSERFHPELALGSIMLTAAPSEVCAELEDL